MGMDADYIKAQFAKLSEKNKKFLAKPENQGASTGILPEKKYPKGAVHKKPKRKPGYKGEREGIKNIHHRNLEQYVD